MSGGMDLNPLYGEGFIRTIPEEMIQKYLPGLAAKCSEAYVLGTDIMYKAPDKDKEYLTLSSYLPLWQGLSVVAVRVNWANNVGMPLPNYERSKIPLSRTGAENKEGSAEKI